MLILFMLRSWEHCFRSNVTLQAVSHGNTLILLENSVIVLLSHYKQLAMGILPYVLNKMDVGRYSCFAAGNSVFFLFKCNFVDDI